MNTESHFILSGINDSELPCILAHNFTFFSYDKIKDEINIVCSLFSKYQNCCKKDGLDDYIGLEIFARKHIDFFEPIKRGRSRISRIGDLILDSSKPFKLYISNELIGSYHTSFDPIPTTYNTLVFEIEFEEDAIIKKRTLRNKNRERLIEPFNIGHGRWLSNGELIFKA
jgi:hypothetical protein